MVVKSQPREGEMVNLPLKDFAKATRRMVELSGVKKSRLMLRVRPSSGRKTFVLKSTDGRTTLTTRVKNQGELKIVEEIVHDFVSRCTVSLTAPPPSAATGGGGGGTGVPNINAASPRQKSSGKETDGTVPAGGNKSGGKSAESGGGKGNTSQKQQQQHGGGNKKRKGGRR
ncbi:hypothetical protein, conserved [Trypanosoma brucei gambiense DAL972]|uniref:SRP9 domain-containing protein n=2 Tax=Trypanosoma brucei TaxID=5691 RepID=C9ZJ12_TRYB9|nr:hypothetical protein, conserved [Trypanosoma brucei gambiense DAL972]CBH09370.1 hypothetical protein, conserved [Trypanosoma brucei gambiense DAL972]|eukprot:XP_011771676.1 hypothetical protein, conserved [Trypanosoma brucei gambiense DAL972]